MRPVGARREARLALTMPAVLEDLGDVQLVGEDADAVLLGGVDETEETNRVFVHEPARAFVELELGAEPTACTRTEVQTARSRSSTRAASSPAWEYAVEVEATVVGKPSAPYFTAALEASSTRTRG